MNCKNCGCNYSSSEPACPHCDTKNPQGESWLLRITAARVEYEKLLRKHGTSPGMVVFNRVINRVLLGLILLVVILVFGLIAYFGLTEKAEDLKNQKYRDRNLSELEQLYTEGRFGEIHAIIDDADLNGSKYKEYEHIGSIFYWYESFSVQRFAFFQQKDTQISESTADSLVHTMNDLLGPMYYETFLTERNREKLEVYRTEARDFAVNMLGFSETQIALLCAEDLSAEDRDALASFIRSGGNAQ